MHRAINHRTINPPIHYWGTPVVLVSTQDEHGNPNIGPMSSAWWLGWTAMLGIDASSKTTANLRDLGECVLNLPSDGQVEMVERIAMLTGADPLPPHKARIGMRHEPHKFAAAGVTAIASETVRPPRIAECPVQLEARVEAMTIVGAADTHAHVPYFSVELSVLRAHVDEALLMPGDADRIDPEKWRPLIFSFRYYFGLGPLRAVSKRHAAMKTPRQDANPLHLHSR
jgi:flavin reductase (DIM6/NTAB) family NADH-FMN oxidoreductase RutF